MKSTNNTKESFNIEFCEFLEHHLCDTFRNSETKEIRRLWCDGIVWNHFTKKQVNDKRELRTMAWIGENGQGEYELRIKFGKYSLRRYAKGANMKDCIHSSDSMNWVKLDIKNKKIELRLK